LRVRNRTGLTVIELLAGVVLWMILITTTVSIASSFFSRIKISGAVSTITTSLSQARYLAVSMGRRVRFRIEGKRIRLQVLSEGDWQNIRSTPVRGEVNMRANASPVFSPRGTASPLCSIRVWNAHYQRIITLSFAGRIKIKIPAH